MKKLMFIAVAALAFCASAASCDWTVDTINDPSSGSGAESFLVYFFDANAAGTSISDANTALASKNVATINTFLAQGVEGMLTDGGYSEGTMTGLANSYTVGGYLVIFDAETVAGAEYAYVSSVENGTTGGLGQKATISFGDLDATATLSNWTQISGGGSGDIPEPTSGLLLLVGGAMLALRRRRA